MAYNCLKCNHELIENKNLDWDCPNCGKTFELFHAGFVEPNLREINKDGLPIYRVIEGKRYKLKSIEPVIGTIGISVCYEPIIDIQ